MIDTQIHEDRFEMGKEGRYEHLLEAKIAHKIIRQTISMSETEGNDDISKGIAVIAPYK